MFVPFARPTARRAFSSPSCFAINERQIQLSILEGEINAAAHHAEVVVLPVHNILAEIVHPADVRSDPNFQTRAELADRLGGSTQVIGRGRGENDGIITRRSLVKAFSLAAAEDGTASRPNIRCKARTGDRIPQGQRA